MSDAACSVTARILATPTPPPKTATWPCLGSLKALLKIKQSNIFIMLASKVDSCECVLMLSSLFLVVFDKRHFLGVVKTHRWEGFTKKLYTVVLKPSLKNLRVFVVLSFVAD